ncbi:MAG: SDR family NAD(P)-dependent oxidoreductase [Caulobacter sp.]|nr:SDR family NAD(P)-dependent oxidoreductase [Caulobacter sp.]
MKLDGLVVVTGGTSGIGLALVKLLTRTGTRVLTCSRHGGQLDTLARLHPGVEGRVVDLGDPSAVDLFAREAASAPGLLGLINNAAGQDDLSLADQTSPAIDREIRTNLTAPAILSARLIPHLPQGGFIANLTSGLAIAPKSSAAVYCATKAGLRNLSVGARNQMMLADRSVRIVDVVLPLVDTPMTSGRGSGKISPERVARQIVRAIRGSSDEVYIGQAALLHGIDRIAPGLARRIMRRG